MIRALLLSAIVMGLSHTIAKERIFEGLRRKLGGHETFFGYLVSCPYCLSHWLAFVLVPITDTYAFTLASSHVAARALSWFLSSIFITVVAAFLRVLFWLVDESQGLQRRREKIADQKIEEKNDRS